MAIQIFILSKLMEDNNYPYKLKKQLSEPIPLDQLGGLTESKLYYHFESLAKQGLVEQVEVIKEEHRPDKQVFAITDKGREELPKKIYKLLENAEDISDMVVGIANIRYVDRDRVLTILNKKSEHIRAQWMHIKDFEKKVEVDEENKNLVEFIGEYVTARVDHTIYWLEELIKQIKQRKI
ncbi:PadR family transcriptional regulator [Pradoshia sp. D12]|uniref:PadR family transcriptional regulator n=1 Tax=Bacillaceae TaxID=186817 RepID=UPI00080AF34F|nr:MULTISPECIES: helix-turn-helix transcriptional regulator [Bacillaceae]OCA89904.1 transcriptional regulator [Bacillus sp. FJAT-27986]QFK70693.1 PadR family transcriptional regulator [Pradoshia sp. D12]TPF72488.1 PadR family transcriptional regulator [Bacillus sp. D12]